jgi:choline dehydrogenase-like flavoprotein
VVGIEAGADHGENPGDAFDTDEITYVVDQALQWRDPEVLVFQDRPPIVSNWLSRNTGVGGPYHWSGFAIRFHPSDFRVASECGIPDGSSVSDWPITYAELAPFYDESETMLAVAAGTPHPWQPPRDRGFPQPPLPDTRRGQLLTDAARRLGWHPFRPPAAIATERVASPPRSPCNLCGHCTLFGCTRNSKASTAVTVLPAARATGRLDVRARCLAVRVVVDRGGRPSAVHYLDDLGQAHEQPATVIVLANNAPYVAKLMLLSTSRQHPAGLGNAYDQVGRHVTFHTSTCVYGLFDERLHASRGPAPQVAVDDFSEDRPLRSGAGFHRGGQMVGGMPASFAGGSLSFVLALDEWLPLPDGVPSYGDGLLRFAEHAYSRHMAVFCLGEDLPRAENRVTLDPLVWDRAGLPALRIEYTHHPDDLRQIEFFANKAQAWLEEAGARSVVRARAALPGGMRAGHAHGTTRMGVDPETSVTNDVGLVHGLDNLFVAGTGGFVTSAGVNPCLTAVALARRAAPRIIDSAR